MEMFQIVDGLDPLKGSPTATAGQKVTFLIRFQDSSARTGSVKIDYGDGTAEDTGPRTFDPVRASLRFDHVYTRPGTFNASVKGGRVQPCASSPGLGFPIPVNVVHNPSTSRTKHADAPAALTQAKSVAVIPASGPGAKNLGTYETVGKEKGNTAYPSAFPGQIVRASVAQTYQGIFLAVQGSGKCAFKVFEELDGKALRTYDYKGPLPTSVRLLVTLNTLPGTHVVRIEGDKSSEGCGGTASASYVYDSRVRAPVSVFPSRQDRKAEGVLQP